eukprot:9390542-Pyramimonas_sp.AAC.1
MTRQDLLAYWSQWERPDAAILGVYGDFDTADMAKLVESTLGTWAPQGGQPPAPPHLPNSEAPSERPTTVYLVDRPGTAQ